MSDALVEIAARLAELERRLGRQEVKEQPAATDVTVVDCVSNTTADGSTSTSYVEATGSASVVTTVACNIRLTCAFRMQTQNSAGIAYARLEFDDAEVGGVQTVEVVNEYVPCTLVWIAEGVAAGTHTLKLLLKTNNASYQAAVDDKVFTMEAFPA